MKERDNINQLLSRPVSFAADDLDQRILDVIRDNARLTYSEIGERAGTSRIIARKRMERMEEAGIIKGYQTVIDETASEVGIHFIMDLEMSPDHYEPMLEKLAGESCVRQIYGVSGECALHVCGIVPNARTLESFANHLYRNANNGIKRILVRTILSTIMDLDGGITYAKYPGNQYLEEKGHGGEGDL